jgi:hypothetical protein
LAQPGGKALHYDFPSKADLGVPVVDRYVIGFDKRLTAIASSVGGLFH